jgi:hypothetical protein
MRTTIRLLLLIVLLSGISSVSQASLTASTAQIIMGNAPRFNPMLEQEINQQHFSLLGFSYLGTTYNNDNIQAMPLIDPKQTIQDFIKQVSLEQIVLKEGDAIDVDGDKNFSSEFNNITITVQDKNNQVIDLNSNFCEHVDIAPMRLQLNAQLKLSTRFGVPSNTSYNVSQTYLIPFKPTICYLKPSLIYGEGKYAGVASVWNAKQGFIYDESKTNFPTTGMDGLIYDVKILGVDVLEEQMDRIYSSSAHVDLMLLPVDNQTLNITLRGPTKDNPQSFSPNIFTVLIGPRITYRFKINNWFIQNNDQSLTWANANNWCNKLGNNQRYQLPAITQLSNASQDVSGQTGVRNYTRAIGQGLLPEWGSLVSYGLMTSHYIWSSTLRPNSGGHYYDTHNVIGSISSPVPAFQEMNLCVSK